MQAFYFFLSLLLSIAWYFGPLFLFLCIFGRHLVRLFFCFGFSCILIFVFKKNNINLMKKINNDFKIGALTTTERVENNFLNFKFF